MRRQSESSVANSGRLECQYCDRFYSKAEHLIRHERTHTGSKPFSCQQCHRQFARQDSLARHSRIHLRNAYNSSQILPALETPNGPSTNVSRSDTENNDGPSSLSAGANELLADIPDGEVPFQTPTAPGQTLTTSHSYTSVLDQSVDVDMQLTWPDSEDLLQTILSSDLDFWTMPVDLLPLNKYHQESVPNIPILPDSRDSGSALNEGGSQAVRNLSEMITNLSANVTAEVASTGITSVFLDGCLHMFFTQFVPSFPVLHRATFVFRDCTHPLLLNAIALGSLFIGPRDAVAKGESLWRLAHTAVATSWQTMINHRGPYDACNGIQLVLTALLGQVYATLSKNPKLRMTGQVFHSLGFYWARHCGMFEIDNLAAGYTPSLEAPAAEKIHRWKLWAAREIQLRALLAHYVLDGQISQFSGDPTCVRHTANPLCLPSSDLVFEASSVDEWITQMNAAGQFSTSFREIFCTLFSTPHDMQAIDQSISGFTIRVILEGLKSLVLESNEADGPAVGTPARHEIRGVLGHIHRHIQRSPILSSVDRSEALIRWHAISLDLAAESTQLCRKLCQQLEIKQSIFGGAKRKKYTFDTKSWVFTVEARRALLHAVAIHEITKALPLGGSRAIHIPSSIFAAATVYCIFSLAGASILTLPCISEWESFMHIDFSLIPDKNPTPSSGQESEIADFLYGREPLAGALSVTRNLLYDLNLLQTFLRCSSQQWGVCSEMESILEQWISSCT